MRRGLLTICAAACLVLSLNATAWAEVTIRFDPNDLLDRYADDSIGLKATQTDARRVHADWANPFYGTFADGMQAGHTQPSDRNTYVNWRNGLGKEGEGIAVFNSWFLDNGAARSWGEKVVIKPGTAVTGTAAAGWNLRIIDQPYGLGGASVQWWTTDPSSRLRPTDLGGADIGMFSITADLYWDDNENGWDESDTAVTVGDAVRFWAGCLNGDDAEFYRSDTQAIFFDDQGWGTLSPSYGTFEADYSTAAGLYGSGFESAMRAVAIPVPGAALLGVIGLGTIGWVKRRLS